jgi:hypothetical protein
LFFLCFAKGKKKKKKKIIKKEEEEKKKAPECGAHTTNKKNNNTGNNTKHKTAQVKEMRDRVLKPHKPKFATQKKRRCRPPTAMADA